MVVGQNYVALNNIKLWQTRNQGNKFRAVALPPRKDLNGWDISSYLNNWKLIEGKLK